MSNPADISTDVNITPDANIPVIDLSSPPSVLVPAIASACSTYGFFQVTSHSIPQTLISDFRTQMRLFFDLPHSTKVALKRDERNARGFFDDELTKRRKDWKEGYDFGVPGSRDWNVADEAGENGCLDGYNRLPSPTELPEFRDVVVRYFDACVELSDRVAVLMGLGLGVDETKDETDPEGEELLENLRTLHTSYLRMNFYPPCPPPPEMPVEETEEDPPLGIYPHTDAGFLTVLSQDDGCHSLQVAKRRNHLAGGDDTEQDMEWITVNPVPGALTINTGDMAMIWSNGRYRAPLHRVRTDPEKRRYSAPFFYNPGYKAKLEPLRSLREAPMYEPCIWGYFRAVRFAGDLTDLGAEVQVSNFLKKEAELENVEEKKEVKALEGHLGKQDAFLKVADFNEPFSVEKYRPMLQGQKHGSSVCCL